MSSRTAAVAPVRVAILALCAVAAGSLAACNLHGGGLTSSSTCQEWLNAPADQASRLVMHMYHEAHPAEPEAGPAAANAVFNVSYECQQSPSRRLADLGDFR